MEKSKAVLKSIDFIGEELHPTLNNKNIVSSTLGGLISTLTILITAVATSFFSQELFFRKKAQVRSYSRINTESSVFSSEFPLLFNFWTNSGINLTNYPNFDTEVQFNGSMLSFNFNEKGIIENALYVFPVVKCTPEIIGKEATEYYESRGFEVNLAYCMDLRSISEKDRKVAQVIGTPGSSRINITVNMCNPKVTLNCGWSLEEFGSINFVVGFVDKFTDVSDFASPVKARPNNFITPISNKMEVNVKIALSTNYVLSDVGYIFSETREERFTSFNNYERNFLNINESTRQIVNMEFTADSKENYIERQYLKVQEFLANMGGFFKGILFLGKFLNYPNANISLIHTIAEIEGKHTKKLNNSSSEGGQLPNNFMEVPSKTVTEIKKEKSEKIKLITVFGFLKNMLCCNFKENSKFKNNALKCLDLQEMIKQRILIANHVKVNSDESV